MSKVFHILHVEDSRDDADLVRLALLRSDFSCSIECVDTEPEFMAALATAMPDAILCDYDMPAFSPARAFAILREKALDRPFIVVSHHVGLSETLPRGMQKGADGYVAKRDLGRLSLVIAAAVDRRRAALHASG
jgi:CheY-like chemotaxis protein